MKFFKKLNQQSGFTLLLLVGGMTFIIFTGVAITQLIVNTYVIANKDNANLLSQFAADAGADYAIQHIGQDENWDGTLAELGYAEETLQNSGNKRSTFEVEPVVTNADQDQKTVTVIGRSYVPASAATPSAVRTIEVKLRVVEEGNFSVVTGVGGLTMRNSSKIVGGAVFINGRLTMSNSAQIGLSVNPLRVDVANQSCPNPPSIAFPELCNDGDYDEPISISNSATIYGDVYANNQSNGAGMQDGGLQSGDGDLSDGDDIVNPQILPDHDRNAQKAAVTTTWTGLQASCTVNNLTKTWPANLHITGDVVASKKCKIIVEGDVWIDGNLNVTQSAVLSVADLLGNDRPVIMVDGRVDMGNSSLLEANALNTGYDVITYKSTAACSPDCADVSGVDLYNSASLNTILIDNSAAASETLFYAKWSDVTMRNGASIGALVGNTVTLEQSAIVTFGASAPGGGTRFWVVDTYQRVPN